MKISAIITGYNYARFLPAAIESVMSQTRHADEIVVVDDGSTDDTREVVARYAAQGVRYAYKENGGAGSARNCGIRNSTGDWIAFLDGDDQWLPDKLEIQSAHVAANSSVGIVTGSEWQVYATGQEPYLLQRAGIASALLYPQILVENIIGNPSLTLVRRACFESVGLFDETMPMGQDWDMWIRIVRRFPVGIVEQPLILFARHDSSLTAGKVMERYRSNLRIQKRYLAAISNPGSRLRVRLSAQSMNFYYTAAALADNPAGYGGRALAMSLAAALLDPTYETRNKVGLLLRTALGRRAASQIASRFKSRPEATPC